MTTYEEEPKDMAFEKMKAQLSTLKPELMLEDSARSMLASLLITIDFRVAENDFEILQLFFKRVYAGIESLRKERDTLKQSLKESLGELEKLKPSTKEDCLSDSEVSPVLNASLKKVSPFEDCQIL